MNLLARAEWLLKPLDYDADVNVSEEKELRSHRKIFPKKGRAMRLRESS